MVLQQRESERERDEEGRREEEEGSRGEERPAICISNMRKQLHNKE